MFLLILVILGLILIVYKHYRIFGTSSPQRWDIDRVSSMVETGDLILFSGSTSTERAIKFYTSSPFSHVALVVRTSEGIWVWEADVGRGAKDGPRVMSLDKKLQRWKGDPTIRIVKSSTLFDFDENKLSEYIKTHTSDEMDDKMTSWLLGDGWREPNKWFCSQLVVDTIKNTTHQGTSVFTKSNVYYSPQKIFDILASSVNGGLEFYDVVF